MSKHIGAYSQYHGPAGKVLTDYTEANIPALWNVVPERITSVANTGAQYTGVIPGYTPEDPLIYTEDKFFFFNPHVNNLANPKLSLNGLLLLPMVEPHDDGTTTGLLANTLKPGNDYMLRIRNSKFELIFNLQGASEAIRSTSKIIQQISTDTTIPAYEGDADILETAGFSNYQDGAGKLWKRLGTGIPAPTSPPFPAILRRQSFDGHYYEAILHNTVHAEVAGLLGDISTDISGPLNELIAWMGGKGGGRIILPPGYNRCNSNILIKSNGIELSGTSTGNSVDEWGSTLYFAVNGAALVVGGRTDLGEARNLNIAINNMALTCDADHTSHIIQSHALTGLRLSTLFCRSIPGLHLAGDNSGAGTPNSTVNVLYENIGGGLNTTSASFIHGVNLGNFSLRNCIITGGSPITDTSSVLYLPASATGVPRIASINSCSFTSFGYGIRCDNSISNLQVSDTAFTDIRLGAVRLIPDGLAEGCRFSNCSFIAHSPPTTDQFGVVLADGGAGGAGRCTRISFNNCQFLHWGRRAIELQDHTSNVHISNCQFEDNCAALDNTVDESVINIGAPVDHTTISGNQIYKRIVTGDYERKPKYGINVLSTNPRLVITNNQIDDGDLQPSIIGGMPVHNPNRGPAHLRKIFNNTRQVFEGQIVSIGPWVGLNIPTAPAGPLTFTAALPLANVSGLFQTVLQRRGKVVSIAARANGNITGPTNCITFNVTKNGAPFGQSCTNLTTPVAQCFDEDIDGNDFLAGDRLGIQYTITNAYIPAGLDWSIFLSVYFD